MKYFDKVRLVVDKEKYRKVGLMKGMIGIIMSEEIRYGCFDVVFQCVFDPKTMTTVHNGWTGEGYNGTADYPEMIDIEDLEYVSSLVDEAHVLENIRQSPCLRGGNWMYKVEDGFVYRVDGTKVNKTAYDYSDMKKLRC